MKLDEHHVIIAIIFTVAAGITYVPQQPGLCVALAVVAALFWLYIIVSLFLGYLDKK